MSTVDAEDNDVDSSGGFGDDECGHGDVISHAQDESDTFTAEAAAHVDDCLGGHGDDVSGHRDVISHARGEAGTSAAETRALSHTRRCTRA